ncbi:MAG: S46 family peptidase [Bacteroidia bacterium]
MKKAFAVFAVMAMLSFTNNKHEEGMFPLSSLSNLELKAAGLKIEPKDIYNTEGNSLVNALVRLGGCTGSFISDQGLIITNHHCVFSSVASLSTPENNYLENGFYAKTNEEELKTTLPCKITLSFEDVSSEVLKDVAGIDDALEQKKKINENIKALVDSEKTKSPDLTIEVSEMLVGKVYTLFRYKVLNDVRIVYVPPKNIGKFGGETDNWEWPRHNADFSIVRAYENGVPFTPEKHLQVHAPGTKEGDFTFILGYPGRTYRNQPAEFLEYQNNYILPIISDWFDFRIDAIKNFAGNDVAKQLKYSGTLASLSNVTKNFKGKMQGLQRTDVIASTYAEQEALKQFAESNSAYKEYLPLFDQSSQLHKRKFELITDNLYFSQLYRSSKLFAAAYNISNQQAKMESEGVKAFKSSLAEKEEELDKTFGPYLRLNDEFSLDYKLMTELLYRLSQSELPELRNAFGDEWLNKSSVEFKELLDAKLKKSRLMNLAKSSATYKRSKIAFIKAKDPLVTLAASLGPVVQGMQTEMQSVNAQIDAIIPRFNDLELAMNPNSFVPDANGTLRFTYGYIKGYEPEDAVKLSPFTTVEGVLEKAVGSSNPDYFLQDEIIDKLKKIEPADVLKHPEQNSVVVGLLYNMDTTGGNSGSPIMDAYGRLVGVNFDRAYTATINDYAWNESYSRSIGVDIRYVLYIMKYFGKADEALAEMNVEL